MAPSGRLPLLLALAVGLSLAGCVGGPGDASEGPSQPASIDAEAREIHLRGHVLTPALVPVADASVSVVAMGLAQRTAADGGFDFGAVPSRLYTLQVSAAGYADATLTVSPDEAAAALSIVLEPGAPVEPYTTTVSFHGVLECAFEALIISPSCDSALTVVPGAPRLFRENQSFVFGADPGWRTLVLDVVFDAEAHPGLDGLRAVVRGSLDPDGGGEYLQYGRWNGPSSFTIRMEPGGNYTDGTEPVPANATGFQVDVYPHGHAYHEACAETSCFLGAGAASNVEFDVYATLFYVESAPAGFTLRA
jgi:hypothetical protein